MAASAAVSVLTRRHHSMFCAAEGRAMTMRAALLLAAILAPTLAAGVPACRVFPTTPHGARGSILRQEYEGLCEKSGCAMRANLEHLDQ